MELLIQGILCTYRDLRPDEEVLYSDLPTEEQIFKRVEHPFTNEEELIDIASVPYEERKGKYNKIQAEWVEREEKRMTYGNGVYASIGGEITYIPASYWGYVNHWVLEHGEKPDYREADRIFFLFMEYICFETEVLAITRGKGRRQGATSLGFYWMWWICGRIEEKRGGSMSFDDDGARKNFQAMFMRGFKAMLPCFVRDFDSKAENFVRFVKPQDKAAKGVIQKRQGLNSYCDYMSNSINSYDSGRVSFLVPDETGKYHRININTYWSKVSPTLMQGRNKVGFAYMPTTVNPANQGGENFEQFWKEANQNGINPKTLQKYGLKTPHKVVRYFVPAYEGYAGCIDKFGKSVIEDPIEPIMGNDGKWITEGAKTVILNDRSLKSGDQLLEHRRDFPLDEFDMFSFQFGECEFNEDNIIAQIENIEKNPEKWYLRQLRLVENTQVTKSPIPNKPDKIKTSISPMDDLNGGWHIFEYPNEQNKFKQFGTLYEPLNTDLYVIGVDTTSDSDVTHGSKPRALIMKKSHLVRNDDTGEMEEKGMMPVGMYLAEKRLGVHFDEEIKKAALWYGCRICYEIDYRDDYIRYFTKQGMRSFLEWTPIALRSPTKRTPKIEPGIRSGDPFQHYQQLQIAKSYIDGTSQMEYNGHVQRIPFPSLLKQLLKFNNLNRTPSDEVIALFMALSSMFGSDNSQKKDTLGKIKLLPQYKIKMPSAV